MSLAALLDVWPVIGVLGVLVVGLYTRWWMPESMTSWCLTVVVLLSSSWLTLWVCYEASTTLIAAFRVKGTMNLGAIPGFVSDALRSDARLGIWLVELGGGATGLICGWVLLATQPVSAISGAADDQRQWLDKRHLTRLLRERTGLPLGLVGRRICYYNPTDTNGFVAGHHVCIAATRAGKGVSAVIPAMIDWQSSIVALDIKGEIYATTARYRRSKGRKVIALNPFGLIDGTSNSFNALMWVRDGVNTNRDIATITEALIESTSDNAHFVEISRLILQSICHYVCSIYPSGDHRRNLLTVAAIARSGSLRETLTEWASKPEVFGSVVSGNAGIAINAGDREFGSFITTLGRSLAWLDEPGLAEIVKDSDFQMEELLNGGLDVYVMCPMDVVDRMRPWVRMMITLTSATLVRLDGRKAPKRPMLLMMDEFARLGRLEIVETIATVSSGYGITMMLITQSLSAVTSVYGEAAANTLISSAATLRVFGLGTGDIVTARWLSECMAEKLHVQGSNSVTNPNVLSGAKTVTSTRSDQTRPAMSTSELLHLQREVVVVMIRGHRPALMRQIFSPSHRRYKNKLSVYSGRVQ